MTMRWAIDSFLLGGTICSGRRAHYSLNSYQLPHSHQVVSCAGEDEDPVHSFSATMAQLAQQANRLQPTEDLFDPFALPLTDLVALVPRGATIDSRPAIGVVLGHVRRHLELAQVCHEIMRVIVLITAQGYSAVAAHLCGEVQSRVALGGAGGRGHASRNRQAITILHQQMAGVAQLCFFAFALTAQHRIRIRSRLMSSVRALLAVKVHRRITRIIRRRLVCLILRLETLQTRGRFQQCAINREVFIAEQFVPARLVQYARKELFGDVAAQQPLTVLRKGGRIPHPIIHVQTHEPAKQHVVIKFFHQQAFAAYAVEHLQQQRSQQLLWRNRWSTHPRVKFIELWRQLREHCIRKLAYRSQRMVRRYALLWRQVTKHSGLLKIVSAHWFSFSCWRGSTTRYYYVGPCAKVTFSAACEESRPADCWLEVVKGEKPPADRSSNTSRKY